MMLLFQMTRASFFKISWNTVTVNSERYIEKKKQVRETIRKKRPSKNLKVTLIHDDNARPYTFLATNQVIGKFGCTIGSRPPYSPTPALSDFYQSGPMNDSLGEQRFHNTDEVNWA